MSESIVSKTPCDSSEFYIIQVSRYFIAIVFENEIILFNGCFKNCIVFLVYSEMTSIFQMNSQYTTKKSYGIPKNLRPILKKFVQTSDMYEIQILQNYNKFRFRILNFRLKYPKFEFINCGILNSNKKLIYYKIYVIFKLYYKSYKIILNQFFKICNLNLEQKLDFELQKFGFSNFS